MQVPGVGIFTMAAPVDGGPYDPRVQYEKDKTKLVALTLLTGVTMVVAPLLSPTLGLVTLIAGSCLLAGTVTLAYKKGYCRCFVGDLADLALNFFKLAIYTNTEAQKHRDHRRNKTVIIVNNHRR
jgi:hypothetical protein